MPANPNSGNPLLIIGDKIQPKPYLVALMQHLRMENALLNADRQIKYAVCNDSNHVALTLRIHRDAVKMILLGPGLQGNSTTIARMLSQKAHIVMVIDPKINPLGMDQHSFRQTQQNLERLGVVVVLAENADEDFFEPLVNDRVLGELSTGVDLESLSPAERTARMDKRLDAVNKFPALPDTQRQVAQLDDLDPAKKWAEAIDPDVTTRSVILKILNSTRYGFRSRVQSIEQAVSLASAKTIREIVTACQIRQLFHKTSEQTIEQFWRHSLAVGFFAKLLSLPADPAAQSGQQKAEFERFQLNPAQVGILAQKQLWKKLKLDPQDDPFTAGLLHDIGKIAMVMCMEDSLTLIKAIVDSEVCEQQQQGKLWAQSILEIERFLMKDLDHQIVGQRLAEKWDLPMPSQQAIAHHHEVDEQSPPLLKLVALANLAGSTLFPYPATEKQHPFPQLFEKLEKAMKKKTGEKTGETVEEAIDQEIFEPLVEVIARLNISECLWELIDFKTFFKLCFMLTPTIRSASISLMQHTG